MFDGTTLIVDVETLGENSYALSLPAEDLWVAYEVVRRHVDANGVRHFSQMVEAKTTFDGYSFKFDTGDTFTCVSHLDKPTSSTLSDTSSELPAVGANDKNKYLHTNESTGALEWAEGGTGGGVLIVNMTYGEDAATLDKTWTEINDAPVAFVSRVVDGEVGKTVCPVCKTGTTLDFQTGTIAAYFVEVVMYNDSMANTIMVRFSADAEDGVLTYTEE